MTKVTFNEIAKAMAGVTDVGLHSAQKYVEQYIGTSARTGLTAHYFSEPIGADTLIDLTDDQKRWAFARTLFHYESGGPVGLPQSVFESGIQLGSDIMAKKFKNLDGY